MIKTIDLSHDLLYKDRLRKILANFS